MSLRPFAMIVGIINCTLVIVGSMKTCHMLQCEWFLPSWALPPSRSHISQCAVWNVGQLPLSSLRFLSPLKTVLSLNPGISYLILLCYSSLPSLHSSGSASVTWTSGIHSARAGGHGCCLPVSHSEPLQAASGLACSPSLLSVSVRSISCGTSSAIYGFLLSFGFATSWPGLCVSSLSRFCSISSSSRSTSSF